MSHESPPDIPICAKKRASPLAGATVGKSMRVLVGAHGVLQQLLLRGEGGPENDGEGDDCDDEPDGQGEEDAMEEAINEKSVIKKGAPKQNGHSTQGPGVGLFIPGVRRRVVLSYRRAPC